MQQRAKAQTEVSTNFWPHRAHTQDISAGSLEILTISDSYFYLLFLHFLLQVIIFECN